MAHSPADYSVQWLQPKLRAEILPRKYRSTFNEKDSNRPKNKMAGDILEEKSELASLCCPLLIPPLKFHPAISDLVFLHVK